MGVHASLSRLQRELSASSPMPSPQKKRDLADFFKPYARHKIQESTIPKKRPSPSAEPEQNVTVQEFGTNTQDIATPQKARFKTEIASPVPLQDTPASALRSGSLPFRSPNPNRVATPASTYKSARLFQTEKRNNTVQQQKTSPFAFVDIPAAPSRDIVRNGKVTVVKDSDDEDTDSLQSLDDIFGRKQDDTATSSSSPPEYNNAKFEAERVRTLSLFTGGRSDPIVGKEKLRELYAKERAHKFDLSGILGDHFDDAEIQSKIEKSRATYDNSVQELEISRQAQINQSLLASLIHADGGGEEDIARLMGAMQRTEALSSDKSFSFFKLSGVVDWQRESPPDLEFPQSGIPQNLWQPKDGVARARAYLSGSMADLATSGLVNDAAMKWTFDSILSEQSDDLRQAYIDCIRCGSISWARTSLTAQNVQDYFQNLGAEYDSLRDGTQIPAKYHPIRPRPQRDPKFLLSILKTFGQICQYMDFSALSKLASILCRLAMDTELMAISAISTEVEHCLEQLLSLPDGEAQLHVEERILSDMSQHLDNPVLQSHLLLHMLPVTVVALRLRIRLAYIFLLGTDTLQTPTQNPTPALLTALTNHVTQSPTFETLTRSDDDPIDFAILKARTYVLDVAISNGGRSPRFSAHAEENSFNKSIDDLADALRARFISIADTGATHMRRTEAKDAMQALYWRLLYSIRTKPRLKKHLFDKITGKIRDGEEVRNEERGQDFMKQFLAKRESKNRAKGAESDAEHVDNTPPSSNEVLIRRQLELA